jgi:SPP1 family predicted phage head-tail adaptor
MKLGPMKYRVEVQENAGGQDEYGNQREDWKTIRYVWADIGCISGREYSASGMDASETDTRIYIRYLDVLTPKMRFRYRKRIFDITGVLADPAKGIMTVMAKEVR